MKINDVEFEPRELQAVLIALDLAETEELDHASSLSEDDDDVRRSYIEEADQFKHARQKFSQVLKNNKST